MIVLDNTIKRLAVLGTKLNPTVMSRELYRKIIDDVEKKQSSEKRVKERREESRLP